MNLSQEIIPAKVVTALHEAAHAVAHAAVGWPCKFASIIAVGNRLGEVRTDRARKYPGQVAEAIMLVAGYVAEDFLFSGGWNRRPVGHQEFAIARKHLFRREFRPPPISEQMERELRAKLDTVSAAIGAEQVWAWWALHAAENCPEKCRSSTQARWRLSRRKVCSSGRGPALSPLLRRSCNAGGSPGGKSRPS